MPTLTSDLRKKLENTVIQAREIAETGAKIGLQALAVHEAKPYPHMNEDQLRLRKHLRAHARQLGDVQAVQNNLSLTHLIHECAYEHWHRMLFARFLAENHLLIEPDMGVAITLNECEELAKQGNTNKWLLASLLAQHMLPQIFRPEDPLLQVDLPKEFQLKLEHLLDNLESAIFIASDAIGWVYQFWQTKRKQQVNDSGVKIGADELPAVTQLFTEDYMVDFMLDNTLGAWWVAKHNNHVHQEPPEGGTTNHDAFRRNEDDVCSPGFSRNGKSPKGDTTNFKYLRFKDDGSPMAGSFDGWPKSAAELKCLDPCCGSGHFLVALFERLVPMRMAEEGLSQNQAARAVLRDNIYGLEIDPRCTQLAAFNLALAAWKLDPSAVFDPLPSLNIACCGLEITATRGEWKALAPEHGFVMNQLYDLFKNAATFGSLIDPKRQVQTMHKGAQIEDVEQAILKGLTSQQNNFDVSELGVTAKGLTEAYKLLIDSYHLVATNVPYLARGKQDELLKEFIQTHYTAAKQDLATAFVERCRDFCQPGGTSTLVTPQNWLFLGTYQKLREILLKTIQWDWIIRLGEGGFQSPQAAGAFAIFFTFTCSLFNENHTLSGLDVSNIKDIADKTKELLLGRINHINQINQLRNPESIVVFVTHENRILLSMWASSYQGIKTGDDLQFKRFFWEQFNQGRWKLSSGGPLNINTSGCSYCLDWKSNGKNFARLQGLSAYKKLGICVTNIRKIISFRYYGEPFTSEVTVLIPKDSNILSALMVYAESPEFEKNIRKIDQNLAVSTTAAIKINFDKDLWTKIAQKKYPNGLPEPYSDDPMQWLFHGRPEESESPLHVAIARLLGYRWPAELDKEMRLSKEARALVTRCDELLPFADDDGIVCLPSVRGEEPAANRLRALLKEAYGDEWHDHKELELVRNVNVRSTPVRSTGFSREDEIPPEGGTTNNTDGNPDSVSSTAFRRNGDSDPALSTDPVRSTAFRRNETSNRPNTPQPKGGNTNLTLDDWLREDFFEQHCKLFHHRPFIWHIWDGRRRDGFHALINYHKLAEGNGKGRKLLENLTYSYLGDWINRQKDGVRRGEGGAEDRLAAALELQKRLVSILAGEPPYDIFVRWKPLHQQAIGWEPDINDGVRMNIRPFMSGDLPNGRKGAGILRWQPNIKWDKDRGKEPERPQEEFPWFWENGKFTGNRYNDKHYTNAEKQQARVRMK